MSGEHKVLTVVIPSYNVEKYLPEIIPYYLNESILEDIELLIVNDGSKDRTEEIALRYQSIYPDTIRVINKPNGGHGSTINRGLQEATGKYFKVIDGDDWVDTDGLVRLIHYLKLTDVDLVMNPFVRVNVDDGSQQLKETDVLIPGQVYILDEIISKLINFYQLHSNTYKTSILKQMKRIDENCFYVDQEYVIYPLGNINNVVYLDFPVYQYRVGNVDQSMSLKNMQKNRKMHEKVIMSLLDFLNTTNHSDNIQSFIKYKIQKMCQLQIDTFFSMRKTKETISETMTFLENVKQKNSEVYCNIPGKKVSFLRAFGRLGYHVVYLVKGFDR